MPASTSTDNQIKSDFTRLHHDLLREEKARRSGYHGIAQAAQVKSRIDPNDESEQEKMSALRESKDYRDALSSSIYAGKFSDNLSKEISYHLAKSKNKEKDVFDVGVDVPRMFSPYSTSTVNQDKKGKDVENKEEEERKWLEELNQETLRGVRERYFYRTASRGYNSITSSDFTDSLLEQLSNQLTSSESGKKAYEQWKEDHDSLSISIEQLEKDYLESNSQALRDKKSSLIGSLKYKLKLTPYSFPTKEGKMSGELIDTITSRRDLTAGDLHELTKSHHDYVDKYEINQRHREGEEGEWMPKVMKLPGSTIGNSMSENLHPDIEKSLNSIPTSTSNEEDISNVNLIEIIPTVNYPKGGKPFRPTLTKIDSLFNSHPFQVYGMLPDTRQVDPTTLTINLTERKGDSNRSVEDIFPRYTSTTESNDKNSTWSLDEKGKQVYDSDTDSSSNYTQFIAGSFRA